MLERNHAQPFSLILLSLAHINAHQHMGASEQSSLISHLCQGGFQVVQETLRQAHAAMSTHPSKSVHLRAHGCAEMWGRRGDCLEGVQPPKQLRTEGTLTTAEAQSTEAQATKRCLPCLPCQSPGLNIEAHEKHFEKLTLHSKGEKFKKMCYLHFISAVPVQPPPQRYPSRLMAQHFGAWRLKPTALVSSTGRVDGVDGVELMRCFKCPGISTPRCVPKCYWLANEHEALRERRLQVTGVLLGSVGRTVASGMFCQE